MVAHVVRAERVVPAGHTHVWRVVASCSMLASWLFQVDGAGEWAETNDTITPGVALEDVSLFDSIAEHRWIRFHEGTRRRMVVVRVIELAAPRHIEWTDEFVIHNNDEVTPTDSRCRFRISVEPSAGDTRVRLSLTRRPDSIMEQIKLRLTRRSTETALAESLLMLEELIRYR